jgi:short-subunit dehydrogenase
VGSRFGIDEHLRSAAMIGAATCGVGDPIADVPAAIRGLPGHGAYCASKAGVVAYCECLRGECRPFGVRVVTLLPGYVSTPLTSSNTYAMPFQLPAEVFAERAFRSIEAGVSYRVIPWQMGVVAKAMRLLPNPLFDRLFASRGRKARRSG